MQQQAKTKTERQARQLRNLDTAKGQGHEHLKDHHRKLLDDLAPHLPEAPSDEEHTLKLFSSDQFPNWLQKWEKAAQGLLNELEAENFTDAQGDTANRPQKPGYFQNILNRVAGTPQAASHRSNTNEQNRDERANAGLGDEPAKSSKELGTSAEQQTEPKGKERQQASPEGTSAPGTAQPSSPHAEGNKPAESSRRPLEPPAKVPPKSNDTQPSAPQSQRAKTPPLEAPATPTGRNGRQDGGAAQSSVSDDPLGNTPASAESPDTANRPGNSTKNAIPLSSESPAHSASRNSGTRGDNGEPTGHPGNSASNPISVASGSPSPGPSGSSGTGAHNSESPAVKAESAPKAAGQAATSPTNSPSGSQSNARSQGNSGGGNADNSGGQRSQSPGQASGTGNGGGGNTNHRSTAAPAGGNGPGQHGEHDGANNSGRTVPDPSTLDSDQDFHPARWESAVGGSEGGYMARPACFYRGHDLESDPIPAWSEHWALWHKVLDVSDGNKEKFGLLRGKTRGNSLVFEVPGQDGSTLIMLPPSLYPSVTEALDGSVPEVPYGNAKELHGMSLSDNPPDELCFAAGKGVERKGNTFFVWHNPERWFPKYVVEPAIGVRQVKEYLEGKVPSWNRPKTTTRAGPGGPSPVHTGQPQPGQRMPRPQRMPAASSHLPTPPPGEPSPASGYQRGSRQHSQAQASRQPSQQPAASTPTQAQRRPMFRPGPPQHQPVHPPRSSGGYSQASRPTPPNSFFNTRPGFVEVPLAYFQGHVGHTGQPGFDDRAWGLPYERLHEYHDPLQAQASYSGWPPEFRQHIPAQQGVRFSEDPPQVNFTYPEDGPNTVGGDAYGRQQYAFGQAHPSQRQQPRQSTSMHYGRPTPPPAYQAQF